MKQFQKKSNAAILS